MKHRVAIVQEYVPKYRIEFFRGLISELGKREIHCDVLAGSPNRAQSARGDNSNSEFVLPLKQREVNVLGKRLVFSDAYARTSGYDLVIFEQARRNIALYRKLIRRKRQAIALWGHGRDYAQPASAASRQLLMRTTERCDWFFGYTPESVDYVVGNGFPARRTTTVMNSIDTVSLRKQVGQAPERELIEGAQFGTRLCYVGGLDESKKVGFLLRSLDAIHANEPAMTMVFVGDGSDRLLVSEFCRARSWASDLGHLSGPAKAEVLKNSDILLNPGRVGLVALDSLGAGIPIVTTDYQFHAPEFWYLSNGETCVVSYGGLEGFVESVVALLSDKNRLIDMRAKCSQKGMNITIEKMIANFSEGVETAVLLPPNGI